MDLEIIEALLLKYDEGETTLEEERILEDFFRSGDVPAHLKADQDRFCYLTDARTETSSLTMEDIMGHANASPITVNFPARRQYFRMITGVAAAVVVAVISLTVMKQVKQQEAETQKAEQEQVAYQQTKHALWLISSKLNKGNQHIVRLAKLSEAETRISGTSNDK